jgi:hypothetical protein
MYQTLTAGLSYQMGVKLATEKNTEVPDLQ